jgi:hypothetical protein
MGLIKKKDRESYFAAKRDKQPLRIQPARESCTTGSSKTEAEAPVPLIAGARNSGMTLAPSVKKSALA